MGKIRYTTTVTVTTNLSFGVAEVLAFLAASRAFLLSLDTNVIAAVLAERPGFDSVFVLHFASPEFWLKEYRRPCCAPLVPSVRWERAFSSPFALALSTDDMRIVAPMDSPEAVPLRLLVLLLLLSLLLLLLLLLLLNARPFFSFVFFVFFVFFFFRLLPENGIFLAHAYTCQNINANRIAMKGSAANPACFE